MTASPLLSSCCSVCFPTSRRPRMRMLTGQLPSHCSCRRTNRANEHLTLCLEAHSPVSNLLRVKRPFLRRSTHICLLTRRSMQRHALGPCQRRQRQTAGHLRGLRRHHLISAPRWLRSKLLGRTRWALAWRCTQWKHWCHTDNGRRDGEES
jgi:hypothetical protein